MRCDAPIFVVGVNRSGTTLLTLMLDCHSQIAIPYESQLFVQLFKEQARWHGLQKDSDRLALVQHILESEFVRSWDYRVPLSDIDLAACATIPGALDQVYSA